MFEKAVINLQHFSEKANTCPATDPELSIIKKNKERVINQIYFF